MEAGRAEVIRPQSTPRVNAPGPVSAAVLVPAEHLLQVLGLPDLLAGALAQHRHREFGGVAGSLGGLARLVQPVVIGMRALGPA